MSLPRTTRSCGERATAELPVRVTSGMYKVRLLKKFRSRKKEMQDASPEVAGSVSDLRVNQELSYYSHI
jgi:hypothetical protein